MLFILNDRLIETTSSKIFGDIYSLTLCFTQIIVFFIYHWTTVGDIRYVLKHLLLTFWYGGVFHKNQM